MENNDEYQSKKERKAKLREDRDKEKKQQIRMRQLKKNLKWLVIIIAIAYGGYWFAGVAEEAEAERPGVAIEILGRDHIQVGDEHEEYNSNPPTSGSHAGPIDFKVYDEEMPDENLIHNIEHGGIWISYKDLDEQSVALLQKIAEDNPESVTMAPRGANDSPIAVASWGRLMKLDEVEEELIRKYIKLNINKSPEPFAR